MAKPATISTEHEVRTNGSTTIQTNKIDELARQTTKMRSNLNQ